MAVIQKEAGMAAEKQGVDESVVAWVRRKVEENVQDIQRSMELRDQELARFAEAAKQAEAALRRAEGAWQTRIQLRINEIVQWCDETGLDLPPGISRAPQQAGPGATG